MDQQLPTHPVAGRLRIAINVGVFILLVAAVAGSSFIYGLLGVGGAGGGAPEVDVLRTVPGVRMPLTMSSEDAYLADSTQVIGVSENGHARAYVVSALALMSGHVVNDILGGMPVSVTYCDRTQCVRAYTAPGKKQPLDIGIGGWTASDGGSMLLWIGSNRYRQDSGRPHLSGDTAKMPYTEIKVVQTDWKQWREANPETDVYVGNISEKAPVDGGV